MVNIDCDGQKMMNAIAIDFGSSNTVIARWNIATNQPETLIFANLNRPAPLNGLVPSLIYVQNAQAESPPHEPASESSNNRSFCSNDRACGSNNRAYRSKYAFLSVNSFSSLFVKIVSKLIKDN